MKTKIFNGLLGCIAFILALNNAGASQIPEGYVLLVPADTFFEGNFAIPATPTATISTTKSSLRVNDEIGYVGEDYSLVTATLRDEAGNPIGETNVNLISSRETDAVKSYEGKTNSNGEIVFQVQASEEGVSAFTAIVDSQTLVERPRIVFLKNAGGVGGSLLRADVVETSEGEFIENSAATDTNRIDVDFPTSVDVDMPTDITITIVDENGIPVEDFRGTISFSSSDELA